MDPRNAWFIANVNLQACKFTLAMNHAVFGSSHNGLKSDNIGARLPLTAYVYGMLSFLCSNNNYFIVLPYTQRSVLLQSYQCFL